MTTAQASVEITGETVKAWRLEKGWTQAQLAAELNVSQGLVSKIEAGATIDGALYRLLEILMSKGRRK